MNSIKSEINNIVTIPDTPELYSPLNQTQGLLDSVTLSWFPNENAESYRIQLSGDSIFTNVLLDSTLSTATSVFLKNLPSSKKYFWRVSALNDSGSSNFTSARVFATAEALLDYPAHIAPANNAINVPIDIAFQWSQITNAGAYGLQIATSPNNCDIFIDTSIVNDTSFISKELEYSKDYYWRLRSLPGAATAYAAGSFSDWYSFTTIANPPSLPILSSPADGAEIISLNPIIRWKASSFTESYDVRISLDADFTQIVFDTLKVIDTNIKIGNLLPNTTYYWSVKAYNEVSESDWSEIRKFTTGSTKDLLTQLDGEAAEFKLYQNYPNPFNSITVIRFGVPVESDVKIYITDIQGKQKKMATNFRLNTGVYEIQFDGSSLASGVYFCTIAADTIGETEQQKNFRQTKKMLIIK